MVFHMGFVGIFDDKTVPGQAWRVLFMLFERVLFLFSRLFIPLVIILVDHSPSWNCFRCVLFWQGV